MIRTSIFKTLNFISNIKSLMYGIMMATALKYIFCISSYIFGKSSNNVFDNTIYSYMIESLIIFEIGRVSDSKDGYHK